MKAGLAGRFRDHLTRTGRVPGTLLLVTMAALPIAPSAAVITAYAALLILVWKNKFRFARPARLWSTALPWMAAFFLLHVLGMLWTSDTGFGLFDLQIKSPLLLLPLLALLAGTAVWQGRDLLLFVFAVVNALLVIVCSLAAIIRIMGGSDLSPSQEIFSSYWSLALHPSYFALYLSTALAAWCSLPMHRWVSRTVHIGIMAVLCLGVVLSASKIGWILLLPLLVALLVLGWRERPVRATLMGMGVFSIAGILALLAFSPYARDRVREMLHAATADSHDAAAITSSEVRWLTWSTAWELFQRDPLLGTGTGDIKNELVEAYQEHGYTGAAEKRLNAHDQFLQTAACLGVPGLLITLAMVLAPLFRRRQLDPLMIIFLLLSAANWLVESMLEVQAGAVYFAVMALLLLWKDNGDDLRPASFPAR